MLINPLYVIVCVTVLFVWDSPVRQSTCLGSLGNIVFGTTPLKLIAFSFCHSPLVCESVPFGSLSLSSL